MEPVRSSEKKSKSDVCGISSQLCMHSDRRLFIPPPRDQNRFTPTTEVLVLGSFVNLLYTVMLRTCGSKLGDQISSLFHICLTFGISCLKLIKQTSLQGKIGYVLTYITSFDLVVLWNMPFNHKFNEFQPLAEAVCQPIFSVENGSCRLHGSVGRLFLWYLLPQTKHRFL